jgi:hypothetical protein
MANNLRNDLIKALLSTEDAKEASGGTEIVVHCPKCRHDHPNSPPHLYIGVGEENIYPISCKHCPLSGLLTPSLLNELGIHNTELEIYLKSLYRNSNYKKIISGENDNPETNTRIIPDKISKADEFKLFYLEQRTGINFHDISTIKQYKIIVNLNSFLRLNKIVLDEEEDYLDEISRSSVGFLSYNGNICNMRNINSSRINRRYVNLKIDKNLSSPFLYIPPTEIDILTIKPIIVVTEGVFDILGVKHRFFPIDTTNIIFGSVGGLGSYKKGINKLLSLTCFFGCDIYIFSDNEIDNSNGIDFYNKALASIKKTNKIKIFYNQVAKDFGDIREKVKLKTLVLK